MNCESAIKAIPLYEYGELPPPEEERLEEHLDGCAACRNELERHRRVMAELDRRQPAVSEDLLDGCRRDLMWSVSRAAAVPPASPWSLLRQGLAGIFASLGRVRVPLGAVALVALGYFSARITGSRDLALPAAPEPAILSVRSVQPDDSGRVRIAVDETRRRIVSGSMDDSRVQQLLLAAARDESNPAVRVESIGLLRRDPKSGEIRNVLLHAAAADPNPGVRLKALEGLEPFASEPDTRRTLAQILLHDDNPGVRVRAVDMLVQHQDGSMVGVLQNVMEKENNGYVRLKCEKALREMNASVGTF